MAIADSEINVNQIIEKLVIVNLTREDSDQKLTIYYTEIGEIKRHFK